MSEDFLIKANSILTAFHVFYKLLSILLRPMQAISSDFIMKEYIFQFLQFSQYLFPNYDCCFSESNELGQTFFTDESCNMK